MTAERRVDEASGSTVAGEPIGVGTAATGAGGGGGGGNTETTAPALAEAGTADTLVGDVPRWLRRPSSTASERRSAVSLSFASSDWPPPPLPPLLHAAPELRLLPAAPPGAASDGLELASPPPLSPPPLPRRGNSDTAAGALVPVADTAERVVGAIGWVDDSGAEVRRGG